MTILQPELKLHPAQAEVYRSEARFKCVVAGRRWGKCLHEGSTVAMADGTNKSVEDVRVGDVVLTINEDTYKLEPRLVQHLHNNGVKETVVVKTRSGKKLRVTPNHPLLANNVWTEAKDLMIGDLIATPRRTTFGIERLPDHEVDLLAIWLAEGRKYTISNTTPEILDVVRSAIQRLGGNLDMWSSDGVIWHIGNGDRSGGPHNGSNNPLRRMLERYGIWELDSKTKFIPDEVFRLPKEQLARFLNLFIACDGSINRRSKSTWAVEIGLANERMLRQIADLMLKFGIRGQISHKIHKAKSSITGDNFESWRFIASEKKSLLTYCEEIGAVSKEEKIAQAIAATLASSGSKNLYLPIRYDDLAGHVTDFDAIRAELNSWRKQSRERISTYRYETIRACTDGYFDSLADGDFAWDEVISVEQAGESQTYDLTVEDNHNFIAEGLVTHNTVLSRTTMISKARVQKRRIWYIAPTYRMAKQIIWDDLLEAIPKRLIKKVNETTMTIRLKNGTIIECKGADKPDTLRGVGLHYVVLDEVQDMKWEVWNEVIRPTLSSTGGHALFIGTPKAFNHLYDLYMMGQNSQMVASGMWESWQFRTMDSPFIPEEELEAAKADLDPRTFRQEYEASFETMSGRVYYGFDRAKHTGSYPFNPNLPIWVGQDFNIDPMSSVILQPQFNGELWAVGELVLPASNTTEVCDELERRFWRHLDNVVIYPDPAGNQRQHARGETDLDIFRERGFKRIKHRRRHPAVSDRINAVNRMLESADGQTRLRIDNSCKELIKSFEQTIYKPNSRDVDKSGGTEHSADAIGYPVEIEYPVRKLDIRGISI